MAQDVERETVGCLVASRTILFEAAHYDPVQIAAQQGRELRGCGAALLRDRGAIEHGRKTSGFTVYLFRGELECEHQRSNLGLSRLHESAVFPRRRVPRMKSALRGKE